VYPEGSAVTATVASGTGQVTTTAQAAQVTQSQQVAANTMPLMGVGGRFRTLTIMTYHVVSSLAGFQGDCDYYQEWNYATVTLDQVLDHLNGVGTLPAKPLLITFDDGYNSQYQAAQELNTRGMTGTWFLATDWVDGTQSQGAGGFLEATPLSWTQVRQMKAWGMDIQAHTKTHPDLTTLSASQVAAEFTACKAAIESQVSGQAVRHLAYPYGAWNSTVTTALAGVGCQLARVVRIAADGTYPGPNLGRYAIASTSHPRMALPSAGTAYTDIVQPNFYRTLSADPELIPDYGFEAGGKGWSLGTGFSVTTSDKHSGTSSLTCVQQSSTVSSSTSRLIPVDPYCRVAISVWIKTSGLPSGTLTKIQHQIVKPDCVTVYQTVDSVVVTGNNNAWTQYSYQYSGDYNAGFLRIYCWLQGNASPTGAAYWDDLSVKRENAAGPTYGWRS
jgi:peptidoglycan/xylan/chitin deacetylase (PgdA/CDA1 family)